MSYFLFLTLYLSVSVVTGAVVTDEELKTFTKKLLPLDVNNVANLITVNLQKSTTRNEKGDLSLKPLLTVPKRSLRGPTISKLYELLDNYERNVKTKETATKEEIREEKEFLDAILHTSIMNATRKFLADKGLIGRGQNELRAVIKKIWFQFYKQSNGAAKDSSSGFEHIFVGETSHKVLGVHNWVNFHLLEQSGDIDYKGYIKSSKLDKSNKGSIISFRFSLDGITKPISSMFIGTSPELELAYYTVCFLARKDRVCHVQTSRFNIVNIQTRASSNKANIETAYPIL